VIQSALCHGLPVRSGLVASAGLLNYSHPANSRLRMIVSPEPGRVG